MFTTHTHTHWFLQPMFSGLWRTLVNPVVAVGQSKGAASSPGGSVSSLTSSSSASVSTESTSSSSLPSFWIPSLTPEAKPTLLKKPVSSSILQLLKAWDALNVLFFNWLEIFGDIWRSSNCPDVEFHNTLSIQNGQSTKQTIGDITSGISTWS